MTEGPPRSEPLQEESNRVFADVVIKASSTGTSDNDQSYATHEGTSTLSIGVLHESYAPTFEVFISPKNSNAEGIYALHTIRLSYGYLDPDSHKVRLTSSKSMHTGAEEAKIDYEFTKGLDKMFPPNPKNQRRRFIDEEEAAQKALADLVSEGDREDEEDEDFWNSLKGLFLVETEQSKLAKQKALEDLQFQQEGLKAGLFDLDPEKVIKVANAINLIFFPENPEDPKKAEQIIGDILMI